MDTGPSARPQGDPAPGTKHRTWLATRFRVKAHWLLVAAGRTLAVMLLALAGIPGWGGYPGADSCAGVERIVLKTPQ